jgi:hypothetical protein
MDECRQQQPGNIPDESRHARLRHDVLHVMPRVQLRLVFGAGHRHDPERRIDETEHQDDGRHRT